MKDSIYDYNNNIFTIGDIVVRPILTNRSPTITTQTVTKIEDDKLYLDNSPQAIRFPNRLLIVTSLFNK